MIAKQKLTMRRALVSYANYALRRVITVGVQRRGGGATGGRRTVQGQAMLLVIEYLRLLMAAVEVYS